MTFHKTNSVSTLCFLMVFFFSSLATAHSELDISAALANEARPEADKIRDAARKPEQAPEFIGIDKDMTVMDVMAGSGYYTELLAAAVGSEGRVVSHNFEWALQMRQGAGASSVKDKAERYPNIVNLVAEFAPAHPPESLWARVDPAPWPVDLGPYETDASQYWGKMDAVFLGLNLHDMYVWQENKEKSADKLVTTIFQLLTPGGVLGLTEHRGIEGQDNDKLHRMTDDEVIAFLVAAGFVIEAQSDILANPLDDHTKFVFDQSLKRNTDRMLIKARKPE